MLTKRTNILLEKTDYQLLEALAKRQRISVGELIRRAIAKTYKRKIESELEQRQKRILAIMKLWEKIKVKEIDYKSLIEYGRKR